LDLTKKFQRDPEYIKITRSELTVPKIEQIYIELKEKTKIEALSRILELKMPKLSMVFCNTKKKVDEVSDQLQARGFSAEGLHGDLKQEQRDRVMNRFRNGMTEILVATDVAARGIDVYDVDIIFNYDLPQDSEYYVHRIGRTGRAGKSGLAYSFIVGREMVKLRDVMKYTKATITRQLPPSIDDIKAAKADAFKEKIRKAIAKGTYTKYLDTVDQLVTEGIPAMDVAAVLLKMHLRTDSVQNVDFGLSDYDRGFSQGDRSKDRYAKKDRFDGKGKKYDDAGMVRLFLNVGRNNNIKVNEIVGCLAAETGLAGKIFGAIDIYKDFTFVDVPKEYVKDVIKGMEHKKMKGVKVSIEKAKKSRERY
jgi:ATP-dependent RNA helicase DeaD